LGGVPKWGGFLARLLMAIFLKGWRSPARRAKLRSASSKWFNSAPHKEVVSRSGTQDRPPNPSSVGAQHALDVLQSRARCALTKSLGQGLGRRLGLLPPLPGVRLAFNPRVGAPGPLGSEQQASGQRGTRAARVASRGRRQLAGMAPAAASGGSTLPSGFSVFTTFPDLLFIFEFVSDSRTRGPGREGTGWAPSGAPHRCPSPICKPRESREQRENEEGRGGPSSKVLPIPGH
jgi:hypothetical protein